MKAQEYVGAIMAMVVLFMSVPVVAWACQNVVTGPQGDTVDVEAYVYAYSNGTVWYDAGVASVSRPLGSCYVQGEFITALGYYYKWGVGVGDVPATYSFPVNEVGPWLTTEALSNSCDSGNIPAVTAFRNGACAMVLHGVSVTYNCTKRPSFHIFSKTPAFLHS